MSLHWIALGGAIIAEVIATASMKASDGMSKWVPSAMVVVFYITAGVLLSIAMKRIDLSVAYAIWCGLGLILTAAVGVVYFGEAFGPAKILSSMLIVIGVVGLSLSGNGH